MKIGNYNFLMTSFACPEQYDVVDDSGEMRGYVRLRGGWLYCSCPDVGGDIVYEAYPDGDGLFASDEERDIHLRNIAECVKTYWEKRSCE